MFVDTTVIIDNLRNYSPSTFFLEKQSTSLHISSIVVFEIIDGLQKKMEIKKIQKLLELYKMVIVQVDKKTSKLALDLFSKYRHSHGISINDSFIAAAAIVHNEELATHNTKHFDFIPKLKLIKPY